MDKPNFYTVQLKLKRHKLAFKVLEEDGSLQLGGTLSLKSQALLTVILPFLVGLVLIIVGFALKLGVLEPIGGVFLIYGGYGITVIKKKKTNNQDIKIIRKGELEILTNKKKTILTKETIKEIVTEINIVTKETYEGKLLVKSMDNEEYIILSMNDKDKKLLDEDLTYLKNYVELKINTANIP